MWIVRLALRRPYTFVVMSMLIVILGVLAAIALPNFTGLTHQGKSEADATELKIVQTAMDVMIAQQKLGVGEVDVPDAPGTNDMEAFPSAAQALWPNYMRTKLTTENYTCTSSGNVTQIVLP